MAIVNIVFILHVKQLDLLYIENNNFMMILKIGIKITIISFESTLKASFTPGIDTRRNP